MRNVLRDGATERVRTVDLYLGKTPGPEGLCALEGYSPSPTDHQLSVSYPHLRASYAPAAI